MPKRKVELTRDQVITYFASMKIHHWIWEKGEELNRYQMGVDRVADISFLIWDSIVEADTAIEKERIKNENHGKCDESHSRSDAKKTDEPTTSLP